MQIYAKNVCRDNSLKVGPDDATEEECAGAEGRICGLSHCCYFSQ